MKKRQDMRPGETLHAGVNLIQGRVYCIHDAHPGQFFPATLSNLQMPVPQLFIKLS